MTWRPLLPLLAPFCATPVLAQTTPAAQDQPIQEVVVTGSLLSRPADAPQALKVLSAEQIAAEPRNNIGEILQDLPETAGNAAYNNTDNGSSPTAFVNLRGLGARSTLVLLNGRRQTVDGSSGTEGTVAVDINNLTPSIMVQRVEVLTDGGSALYGSDAVAGVVNFITRKNFDGFRVSAHGSALDRSSKGRDGQVGVLWGNQTDATSIVAGLEYTRREALDDDDVFSDNRLALGNTSTYANPGSFQPVGGAATTRFADPLCGSSELGGGVRAGIVSGRQCILVIGLGGNLAADTDRMVGLATLDHSFTDSLTGSMEFGFARARFVYDSGYGAAINPATLPVVPATNPGVIAENARSGLPIRAYQVFTRVSSPLTGDPLSNNSRQDTYRIVGSLTEKLNADWDVTGTLTYSTNDTVINTRDTLLDRFQAALNCQGLQTKNVCYNPFANAFLAAPGDPNYNDPALLDWMYVYGTATGRATLKTGDLVVRGKLGELGGQPIGLAVGAQYRDQFFGLSYDPITQVGGFAFASTPQPNYSGSRQSRSVYAELGVHPTSTTEVSLQGRYENYGSGVTSFNPKLGLSWKAFDSLLFRATGGTSFRVPNETESFGKALTRGAVNKVNGTSVDAQAVINGDPDLMPEKAHNYTFGLTWTPLDALNVDLTYWRIRFKNLVVRDDPTVVLQDDMADGVITDPRIILRPGAPNTVANMVGSDIASFQLGYHNQDFENTDGIDFRLNYALDAGGNRFGASLDGSYVLKYELSSGNTVYDGRGSINHNNPGAPMPTWTGTLRLDWERGPQHAGIATHYMPPVREDAGDLDTQVYAFTTVDVNYIYTFQRGCSVNVGVVNAFDKDAPVDGTVSRTVETQLYDPRGRLYRIGLNWSF
jgi:outer membrane receptor protein involved in Fe transport